MSVPRLDEDKRSVALPTAVKVRYGERLATCLAFLGSKSFKGISANAAVEFALILPVFIVLVICMIDFAYAYYVKLRLVIATNAAAQYAFVNGQSLTTSGIPAFISNVQAVVSQTVSLPSAPTITVLVNNAPNASTYANNYCLSGSPATWYSTSQLTLTCSSGVTSGKFVTITVSSALGTIFRNDPIVGSILSLSDFAIVRIQ